MRPATGESLSAIRPFLRLSAERRLKSRRPSTNPLSLPAPPRSPTDYPAGVTATGECVLEVNGASTPTYCVLICDPTVAGDCGTDATATCQPIQGTGVCSYSS